MTAIVLRGDAAHLPLPDGSVDLIVTSPPYFGQRDYRDGGQSMAGQIGSEERPADYIAALLRCTAEWARVLKPSGSIFVNLGDKYAGVGGSNGHGWCIESDSTRERRAKVRVPLGKGRTSIAPSKSLMGLPWRYALACMDDLGLILRAEVVWSKPNGLPESVTDRVRRSHEQVFHFTRQPRYFSAVDEVREPHVYPNDLRLGPRVPRGEVDGNAQHGRTGLHPLGKLPGSVWSIPSAPLSVPASLGVDHFAAYPPELCRRIILGWSPPGVCAACGEGRRPVSEADPVNARQWALSQRGGRAWHGDGADPKRTLGVAAADRSRRITGYVCACPEPDAPTRPAVVVDPFGGTGTTALVAAAYGRTGVTVDRSADYCRLARWRTRDPGERARAMQVPKPPPVPEGQRSLFDDLDATA